MSRAYAVFLAAIATIAVHVVDDSFISPEPGTSAGDHVVSGLVPLAALASCAWFYRSARDGVRAAMAFVLGLFGIAASAEGWYAFANGVVRGDDFTGLLALPAGVALLILGTALLWRSRRRGPTKPRAIARRSARSEPVSGPAP